MTYTALTPLQAALDWWATQDNMGGFKAAGKALFPGWKPNHGCCLPPHREDRLPSFSIGGSMLEPWYFKDWKTSEVGGLTAFVMLSGMDTPTAHRWLMESWERLGGDAGAETGAGEDFALELPSSVATANATAHANGSGIATANTTLTPPEALPLPATYNGHQSTSPPTDRTPFPASAPDGIPWIASLGEAIVSSHELQTMALQPRPKLLGDWFCEGDLGFIYAFRGVGKTWLAMLMARALSEGGRLGEWQAHAPVRTLYVDGEMPPDLMRQRDRGLARSPSGKLEFLNHEILFRRTHRVMNITSPDVQGAILERCEQTGVKVLILDNLSTLASGMKENDADDWEMVGRWLLSFRRRQIAVVMIHHAGRNGEMRGTTKREDDAGWIVALDDARQAADDRRGARFITRFSKQTRNTPEEVPPYEWHISPEAENGLITVTHTSALGNNLLRKLIEEGITDCGELAEELKVSKGTVSKWAHKGIAEGWLTKEGRSYALRDSERKEGV